MFSLRKRMAMSNLMSVVILNWNRLKYTKVTLERIIEASTIPMEIILVDNNSMEESGVRRYLLEMKDALEKKFIKVIYVFNDKNLGVAGGRNSGLVEASGDYLVTIDDDVWVPDNWDTLMAEACDKIPGLGITGVNVEPIKFPVKNINGVDVRPKQGNLGGACLCLPRRVFKRVGYYNYFNTYGMEDCAMYYRLTQMKLLSAYIVPKGKHLDTDSDKEYRKAKDKAQSKGSPQMSELSKYLKYMRSTGDTFVPFDPNYEPEDINIFTNDLIKKG